MHAHTKAQLQIHLCVLLWGFTAILGKLITLPALPLVLWRMSAVTLVLALTPRCWRAWRAMDRRLVLSFCGVGVLVALHWLTFYAAIKLANASVAVTCLALGPLFLSVIEPLVAGRSIDPRETLFGAAVVPGVFLVVGGVSPSMRLGIAVGSLSALLVSVFSAFNKRLVHRADPLAVTGLELGAGALVLLVLAPLLPHTGPAIPIPGARDAGLLALLSLGCTLLPFTLSLVALRHLTAFAAQLAVNLEPVYAILLAIPLLGEQRELSGRFYLGVAIVLAAVLLHAVLQARSAPPTPARD